MQYHLAPLLSVQQTHSRSSVRISEWSNVLNDWWWQIESTCVCNQVSVWLCDSLGVLFKAHRASWKPRNTPGRSKILLWRSLKDRSGYKKISQALNISRSTVQAIILKMIIRPLHIYQAVSLNFHLKQGEDWSEMQPRGLWSCLMNCRDIQLRWESLSIGQQSVVKCANLAFMEEERRRKTFLKNINNKSCLKFATSHLADTPNMWKKVL